MRTPYGSSSNIHEITHFTVGLLDNFFIPVFLHHFIDSAWVRSEVQYYFCHLYLNKKDNQNELSRALYNISAKDIAVIFPRLKNLPPLPWKQETLTQVMRLSGFCFKEFSNLPIYRQNTFSQSIAKTTYSFIHYLRYWCIKNGMIDSIQKITQLSMVPTRYFFNATTANGSLSIPTFLTMALIEELIFRSFLQGFLLTTVLTIILPGSQKQPELLKISLVFLRIFFQAGFFSATHVYNQFYDLKRFVGGVIYGSLYELTGNIFSSTLAHFAYNMRNNYELLTADRESEINYSSHLDPALLQHQERVLFNGSRPVLFPLLPLILARTLLSAIAHQSYQELLSPLTVGLFVLTIIYGFSSKPKTAQENTSLDFINTDFFRNKNCFHPANLARDEKNKLNTDTRETKPRK